MDKLTRLSKFLSLILRHKPETIGLSLDSNGWADVNELIQKVKFSNRDIDIDTLITIVEENDKSRFSFNEDKTKIRAVQGHSVDVDLNLTPSEPPIILYHGTAIHNIKSIKENGISKMKRHHVHLSDNLDTAKSVGSRYGNPVVLVIDSKKMYDDGIVFLKSQNGVWLTYFVDSKYIQFDKNIYHT